MDTITTISIAAGVAGILSLIYLAFIGQKSLPEIWSEWSARLRKSSSSTVLNNLPQSDSQFVDRKKEIEKEPNYYYVLIPRLIFILLLLTE